jgi:transposase
VTLAEDERTWLRKMLASGKAAARKLNHARILLYADQDVEGLRRTDQQIADTLGVGLRTVARVRQRCVEEGIAAALQPCPRPHGAYRLDEQAAAHIIEVAKGEPLQGRKRWTLRLIADRLIVLGYGAFSHETVRQVLKKRGDTVAGEDVVHPADGGCGVRRPDGGPAGVVSEALRCAVPCGVYG